MLKLVAGVDDAGRGAIIGPLVIGGVLFREVDLSVLKSIGVKDSKLLSPKRRKELAEEIKRIAVNYVLLELSPKEVDEVVLRGKRLHKLNALEAEAMARVISKLKPDEALVDASDVLEERFGRQVREKVPFPVEVISKHKADRIYPVVSAASIISKVRRDEIISQLKEKYGDLGAGYITDPKTRSFLIDWFKKHKSWPDFVRKSWKPLAKIEIEVEQRRL